MKTRITKNSTVKIFSYEYDHLGRKVSFTHNGKPIVKYLYDAIGRLQNKKFSPSGTTQGSKQTGNWTDASNWLSGTLPTLSDNVTINTGQILTIPSGEKAFAGTLNDKGILRNFGTLNMGKATTTDLYTQSYKYHIRGGLRGINLDANNDLTNSLFSYKLTYEDGGFYDGNIGNQFWKSNIDGKQRAYQYTYDGASRLKSATFASTQTGENYALNNVDYDANGNILSLIRNGATNSNYTTFGNVDNLTYTYPSNSNKLLKIADATTTNTDLGDFRDGINTGDDYEYWADGSLKKDRNKKIASITYNFLKRPEIITFDNGRTITTEYDADGTKLKKIDSNGEVTDYEEDDIYEDGVLYQTTHDEGRIANGVYEYNITDHNNDLRVSFRDSSGIAVPTQSIFYDPWGLSMKGMQITRNPLNFNKYQFLNRETQFETGYIDLINRQFDPQTGRFVSQDPVIEGQEHLSLYQYGWNNPVLKSDPNGDCPFCPAIPFIPEIGAGLVVAGEAIAGLFVGGATGTAIGMAGSSDGNAMIPYNVQLYAKKVEAEMGQSGQSQGKGRGAEGANNKKKGDEFEKKVTEKLKQDGHTDVAEQITVKPNPDPGGQTPKKVKLDNVSQKDGKTKLTDAKSSETAPNTQNQKDGYPLIERNGGTVTGKGAAKKGYREGTKIPPTKVDIIRPKDL